MDNIVTKKNYDGVTIPAPATEVHTADELNDRRVELQGAVTDSIQTLDSADPAQLSKAMFANGVAAQSMLDSGAVNTVVITPVTGASGLRVATPIIKTYALLDGAIFNFQANNTNTGNMTVNVGQSVGTLIGAESLFLEDGITNIPVGLVVSGKYYIVRYDLSSARFVLLNAFAGRIIQIINTQVGTVATGTTIIPFDDTIPQSAEGDQYLTLAITPSSASSKLKIDIVLNLSHTSGGQKVVASLFKDSDTGALAAMADSLDDGSGDPLNMKFSHFMVAGTTSIITFKIRAGSQAAGTTTFNGSTGSRKLGGVMASSITITEISQ